MGSEDSSSELFAPGAEAPQECNCDPLRELDGYTYKAAYLHAAGCPKGQQPEEPPPAQPPEGPHCETCTGMLAGWCRDCGRRVPDGEQPACIHRLGDLDGRECPCPSGCGCCKVEAAEPPPAQPLRRPPYAVAYSAGGHLYEVMLPGDATVSAVDGALVIKHARFQIHGIVAVQPINNEENHV